jgi:hypothetical protein
MSLEDQMSQSVAVRLDAGLPIAPSTSKRAFARHFVEMVAAMLIGMAVFGGLATAIFAAAGSGLGDQSVGLRVTLMGVYMTVPMVAWMKYRGHGAARNAEMGASMMVPSLVVAAVAWTAGTEAGLALGIQHTIMIPAMFGVMLWRYTEYARPHA